MAEWVNLRWRDIGYHLRGAVLDGIVAFHAWVLGRWTRDD